MSYIKSIYRTHTCGQLRESDVGQEVTLSGWVLRKRDHGGVVFLDLRDNYGVTQVVISGDLGNQAQHTRVESVVKVSGKVVARTKDLINPKLDTGTIEVQATKYEVLSTCDVLPFQIAEDDHAPETSRLKFRFLELRREKLHKNILLRSAVIRAIRDIMPTLGFTEFQTPILTSSSPEGARDFIVPSRLHPGKFFALPQAPQQFKQLLMVSGFDRYFQIAPCFRDEDSRADRSPGEFYQLDIECSFVEQEDIFQLSEQLFKQLFERFSPGKVELPFPRIPYEKSMSTYGSDKPDLRNTLVIQDVTNVFKDTTFRVFRSSLDAGSKIRAIKIEVDAIPSRKYFDDTIELFNKLSGQGVAYISFEEGGYKGNIQKFVTQAEADGLRSALEVKGTTVVFLAAGPDKAILPALGKLRTKLGEDFGKIKKEGFKFCWITDFPFYEEDTENGGIQFSHNPFSMPQGGMDALLNRNPLEIKAFQYDIVCNGYELSSGAIRNHLPEVMYKAFEIVGYPKEHVDEKFGAMVRAFHFGAPPHGGLAPGIDRIVMLLAGEEAIREVIAFPLAQSAEDLLMNAPSTVSEKQLREVHIQLKLPPEKKEAVGS